MSAGIASTWDQRWADLGNVPASRIVMRPSPGTATLADVVTTNEKQGRLCELIDGTLVEKAMGWQESLLTSVLIHWMHLYLDDNKLGVVTGPDGMTRLFDATVRAPDVAFVAWDRLPNGRLPESPIPDLVPSFVIEVLSAGNTYSEMSRKRREYFQAGVELLWMVDPRERNVAVYRAANEVEVAEEGSVIDGGAILPGWRVDLGELFAKLDERPTSRRDKSAGT